MKKIKYLYLLLFLAVVAFTGCEKKNLETEGVVSNITTYVTIEITNGDITYAPKGVAYVDAGATALGGETVTVESNVDSDTYGIYQVSYSAVNAEGYPASVTRTVIVYAQDDIIAGVYDGVRDNKGFGGIVLIYPTETPNVYWCTDYLAGYYDQYLGYGGGSGAYAGPGYLYVSGNTFTGTGNITGWGDSVEALNGVIGDGVVTYTAGPVYTFFSTVTLTKRVI